MGDVAAGTDVLAQENVEELLPLPLDFTGDGQLFMLRVRGDSMIEAGILDGDYVVARTLEGEPAKGDVVVAGIPGDEATVKTYTRKGGKIVLLPANRRLKPMELAPGRRARLRQGRHRPAPTLTDSEAPCSSSAPSAACTVSRSARVTCSPAVCARLGSPGPKLVAGMPCAANRDTSVQPSLARGACPVRVTSAASNG